MYYDVITIGTATRDVYFLGVKYDSHKKDPHAFTGEAICFSLGSKIYVPRVFFTTGGGGTNTAVTFARQGFLSGCIIDVGDDIRGEEVVRELRKENVQTNLVFREKGENTAYSLILLTSSGERTILVYQGAGSKIEAGRIPWQRLKTKWLYLDSLHGNIPLIRGIIHYKYRNPSVRIAWNPSMEDLKINRNVLRRLLRHIDVFISNQEEAAFLTGKSYRHEREIFRAFDALIPGIAVMTKGPKGIVVSDGKTMWRGGVYREKRIVDRTGAGDAFASGFVAGLMHRIKDGFSSSPRRYSTIISRSYFDSNKRWKQEDIEYAIRLGSANATAKVEGVGAKFGLLRKGQFEKEKRWQRFDIQVSRI